MNITLRFNDSKDKDIIEFIKKQSNYNLILRILIRKAIEKYGIKDLSKELFLKEND